METQAKGRVVLVPLPFPGHMTPMLLLGAALYSKGFSITVVHTKYNSPNCSNYPDFSFHSLSDNLKLPDQDLSKGVYSIEILNNNCKQEFHQHLARMMEQYYGSDRLLGIIHDDAMYFVEAIAKTLKLPSFIFRVHNASYLHALLATPRLHEQGHIPVRDSMLQELVPELYPLRFKDLPTTNNYERTSKLVAITSGTRTSSGIIWNTIDFLEQSTLLKLQEHYQVPVFPVAPLHKFCSSADRSTSCVKEDRSCIEWLDKQASNSVIYASLGSTAMATMGQKHVVEIAWGLANSDQPFLWVVQPGSVVPNQGSKWTDLFPEGFIEKVGERGRIVKWAPQKEVLGHSSVGGFWSHCGWNSCLESISEGVPMICSPCFGDHTVNRRYVSYVWKVGVELGPVLERREIESAIRKLLLEKEGKELRQRAIEMKEKIRACVQEGGSSYKSLSNLAEFLPSCSSKSQGLDVSSG